MGCAVFRGFPAGLCVSWEGRLRFLDFLMAPSQFSQISMLYLHASVELVHGRGCRAAGLRCSSSRTGTGINLSLGTALYMNSGFSYLRVFHISVVCLNLSYSRNGTSI